MISRHAFSLLQKERLWSGKLHLRLSPLLHLQDQHIHLTDCQASTLHAEIGSHTPYSPRMTGDADVYLSAMVPKAIVEDLGQCLYQL
jgi:hypothetical protein